MEWTTQTGERQAETFGNGHDAQPPNGNGHETQPLPTPPTHLPEESVAPPVTIPPAPVPPHHAAPTTSATPQAPSGYEQCPSCGAMVAVDQRYCLECGHRRGEPRLPFMDAVVFMDAMNRPPEAAAASTKSRKRGISPNAALIAGVGTLLLALGVGVMIGRSGDNSSAGPASQAPIVIKGGGRRRRSRDGVDRRRRDRRDEHQGQVEKTDRQSKSEGGRNRRRRRKGASHGPRRESAAGQNQDRWKMRQEGRRLQQKRRIRRLLLRRRMSSAQAGARA